MNTNNCRHIRMVLLIWNEFKDQNWNLRAAILNK